MDTVPNRANNQAAPNPPVRRPVQEPARSTTTRQPKRSKWIPVTIGIIVLLALLGFGGWWALHRTTLTSEIDGSKYQAVFFTNGQVYFGKLHVLNDGYFKLNDIFYLQAKDSTAKKSSDNLQKTSNKADSDVQLIKLGSEIHGPTDQMVMNKDQILFFENLTKDGKVADSIGKYYSQKK